MWGRCPLLRREGAGGTARFCAGEGGVHVDHRTGEGDEATAVDADRAAATAQLRVVVAGERVAVTAQPRAVVTDEHIAATAQLRAAARRPTQLAALTSGRATRASSTHSDPFHLSPTRARRDKGRAEHSDGIVPVRLSADSAGKMNSMANERSRACF
jgi:hypothetical protein